MKGSTNMILSGKTVKNTFALREAQVNKEYKEGESFRDCLEIMFLELCKKLDIEAPLWMKKNTREFAMYNKTVFFKEQFVDAVYFDFFELKVEK